MKKVGKLLINVLGLLAFVAVLTNCGGGGGGGGGSSLQPPAANLTGTWTGTDTVVNSTCSTTVGDTSDLNLTIAHDAGSNNFTFPDAPSGSQISGTINGTAVSITATNVPGDNGGYNDLTFSGTLNTSTMTINGTLNWSLKSSISSAPTCSGTNTFTVTCTNCATGGGGGGGSDTTPPSVVSTNPAANATNVAVNSLITATFSEAMDGSTINATTFTLKNSSTSAAVSGTVTYNSAAKSATFKPSANLATSTTYSATITTGVKDLAGNAMAAAKTWSFTTGATSGGPSPTDTIAYAKFMAVGGWSYAGSTCQTPPYPREQLSAFLCPGGGLKGVERSIIDSSHTYDYLAKGTYSITSLYSTASGTFGRIYLDYTTSINIGGVTDSGPGYLGGTNTPMVYFPSDDTIRYWWNSCWNVMTRLTDGSNTNVDNSYCTGSTASSSQCGTDCDCGHCWYCESGTCRYGGEGPYGCYRGCN